jgi:hypothetical protein
MPRNATHNTILATLSTMRHPPIQSKGLLPPWAERVMAIAGRDEQARHRRPAIVLHPSAGGVPGRGALSNPRFAWPCCPRRLETRAGTGRCARSDPRNAVGSRCRSVRDRLVPIVPRFQPEYKSRCHNQCGCCRVVIAKEQSDSLSQREAQSPSRHMETASAQTTGLAVTIDGMSSDFPAAVISRRRRWIGKPFMCVLDCSAARAGGGWLCVLDCGPP